MMPAIMMVNPTPIATPNMPTEVWRNRGRHCRRGHYGAWLLSGRGTRLVPGRWIGLQLELDACPVSEIDAGRREHEGIGPDVADNLHGSRTFDADGDRNSIGPSRLH